MGLVGKIIYQGKGEGERNGMEEKWRDKEKKDIEKYTKKGMV